MIAAGICQQPGRIQRELPGNTLFEIAYVGTKGTDLGLFRRFNTPAQVETGADLPPRPGDLQSLRTFPQLGTLFQLQHIANSIYHSLQLKAEKRFTGRLSFLASFVWAKSIDDADTQAKWYYRLKREYRHARAEGRPFRNPVESRTLEWRS